MSVVAPVADETPPCPLCGSTEDGIVVGTMGRFGMPVRDVACRRCALVYQTPRPNLAAMTAYYAGEYRKHYGDVKYPGPSGANLGPGDPGYEEALEIWHGRQAESALILGAPGRGAKVLEIGCRHGRTLGIMRERAGIEPFGVEPGPDEAKLADANGIRCFAGALEAFDPGETRFDQIQLFHVLEHLHDPLAALVRLRSLLAPTGKVVVEVPNVHQPYGFLEENFFQNAHLTNFSADTLLAMFRRAGLAITHVIDREVLFVVGTPAAVDVSLPLPFDAAMLPEPTHDATWVAERLATYATLEKIRHILLTRGPTMELLEALVTHLRKPAFLPHLASVVKDSVEYFARNGALRAASVIANAASMGPHGDEMRDGFQRLAAAIGRAATGNAA